MKNAREYLDEIKRNVAKMRAQGQVTPTDNALFGMIDGLAGLQHTTMERVAELERRVAELQGVEVRTPVVRPSYPSGQA